MDEIDPARQHWDAIIIGTGMGGATLGYALAKAGLKVLFCEKGRSHLIGSQALKGKYAESFFPQSEAPKEKHSEILAHAGRWTTAMEDRSYDKPRVQVPFVGCGTGGSSALYGMALERFQPDDFRPKARHPNAVDAALPERWPISYAELRPYYEAAERLYRVRGAIDPLRDPQDCQHLLAPPPLSEANQELYGFLQTRGMHPYQLPLACEQVAGCRGCQGFLCDKDCKNDSARICLQPALNQHGAQLLDECEITRLESQENRVTTIHCVRRDQPLTLTSELVVLAAGALQTPSLLLRSASRDTPHGLANGSGLVGRYLMRHCIDLHLVFPKTRPPASGNLKEIAFNDLQNSEADRFGSVQSFGRLPPAEIIIAEMEQDLDNTHAPFVTACFRMISPLLRVMLSGILSRGMTLATIMEDLPYRENRVMLDEEMRTILNYRLHTNEQKRIAAFRRSMREILHPYRYLLLKQAENNSRIAHVCGTCRFGDDPQQSVLNAVNRAHEVSNLYVVDTSFFPTSGGTNPALTVAANALRVADHILGKQA